MSTSLKDNSYHILGLDCTATSKQILQRANEITQRLKIDDQPEYDLDMSSPESFRKEGAVKDALRRLQSPRTRLKEYFFWFRIADDVDAKAAALISKRNYEGAIRVWSEAANGETVSSLGYRRNLAVARCIALVKGDGIKESLAAWKYLLDSSKFWDTFLETYQQDSDTLSSEAIAEFQSNVTGFLSDIYAELQQVRGSTEYVYQFRQVFDAKGQKIEKDILNPVYQSIQLAIEQLEQIKVVVGDRFDGALGSRIKSPVALIQSELNKLIEAGLYEDSSTKVLRDRASNALRSVVLDIHNHLNELEASAKLLAFASQIAGTDSLRALLTAEQEQIQNNIASDQKNTVAIEIPGTFGGGTIIFKNDHVTYDGRKILYKDATAISYYAISRSLNLVPYSQSYSYMVSSDNQTINLSFGTTLYIGNKTKKDAWGQLASISQHIIGPHIVEKLVRQIFADGNTVRIGGLEFTREGYSRGKIFGGREHVSWKDPIYIPKFGAGNVTVWKDKGGKGVSFETLAMSVPNAVVLPELVKACLNASSNAKR
jgi:hypothetical protein